MCNNKNREKKYTEKDIELAIKLYRSSNLSIASCGREFNVPRNTLHRRLSGKSGPTLGKNTILSSTVEKIFADTFRTMSDMGFGLSKTEVTTVVNEYLTVSKQTHFFNENGPGCLDYKNASCIEANRAQAFDSIKFDKWFKNLKEIYDKI
jgi:hypothetical protein